jgi:hypothetical protein
MGRLWFLSDKGDKYFLTLEGRQLLTDKELHALWTVSLMKRAMRERSPNIGVVEAKNDRVAQPARRDEASRGIVPQIPTGVSTVFPVRVRALVLHLPLLLPRPLLVLVLSRHERVPLHLGLPPRCDDPALQRRMR